MVRRIGQGAHRREERSARPSCGLRVTGGHEARFIGEYDGLYTIT